MAGTPSYRGSPHALHGQLVLLLRRQQLHGACGMNTWLHHHLRACLVVAGREQAGWVESGGGREDEGISIQPWVAGNRRHVCGI